MTTRDPCSMRRVDPRVCGGAVNCDGDSLTWGGRSPRVRGSLQGLLVAEVGDGSIPACAGEPYFGSFLSKLGWVDPRVCGGAADMAVRAETMTGRSPRVRGSPDARVGG